MEFLLFLIVIWAFFYFVDAYNNYSNQNHYSYPTQEIKMNQKPVFIILKESPTASIIKDTFSTGSLFLLFWLNHEFMSMNTFVNIFIIIISILFVGGKMLQKKLSGPEAIEKIQEIERLNPKLS